MYANEDIQRLLESRHDVDAAENTSRITASVAYQDAIGLSRVVLSARRAALGSAAATYSREKSETDKDRIALQVAVQECIRWYDFIRDRVASTLLKPAPNMPVAAAEIERRRKLFDRIFRIAPSEFSRIATGSSIEIFGTVAHALATEPDLMPLGFAADMANAHTQAASFAQSLNREIDEDSTAMKTLREAREGFDRAAQGHARLVEGILIHEGKEKELGQFVLAKDALYAARRAAQVPITEEPGAGEVNAEMPAPTQG